jgi:thiol-disulfide isomerase/thioredoxin
MKRILIAVALIGLLAYSADAQQVPKPIPNALMELTASWCPHCRAMIPVVTKLAVSGVQVMHYDIDSDITELTDESGKKVMHSLSQWMNGGRPGKPRVDFEIPMFIAVTPTGRVIATLHGEQTEAALRAMLVETKAAKPQQRNAR